MGVSFRRVSAGTGQEGTSWSKRDSVLRSRREFLGCTHVQEGTQVGTYDCVQVTLQYIFNVFHIGKLS